MGPRSAAASPVQFALVVRGYDRGQVDEYISSLLKYLEEAQARALQAAHALEEERARGPAPRRLDYDELGPHIAAVLRQAETEAARMREEAARAVAEQLEVAQERAEELVSNADERAEQIVAAAEKDAQARLEQGRREATRLVAEANAMKGRRTEEIRRLEDLRLTTLERARALAAELAEAVQQADTTVEVEVAALASPETDDADDTTTVIELREAQDAAPRQ